MPEVCVDLPWPPSANKIWRSGNRRVYRDPSYLQWLTDAGWCLKGRGTSGKKIRGEFSAHIILCPPNKRLLDIDNRVKVLLDFAQRHELIENDHYCRRLLVEYGSNESAPLGARLILTTISSG